MLRDSNGRPDILVLEPNVSPVVIETEVLPAITVELEACSRLGCVIKSNGKRIVSSVAVRFPKRIRDHQGDALVAELMKAEDLELALYTGSSTESALRHPKAGWLLGSAKDLSVLTQAASVPPELIEKAVNHLVAGVSQAAGIMQEMDVSHPGAMSKICEELKQDKAEQTFRMAATILANALVFQESLANGPGELASVRSLEELRVTKGDISKSALLEEWKKILLVNYWPIFDIARRILQLVPLETSRTLIASLSQTAEELVESRLMRSHDLTGAVFQRLIADRKFLAAYYTTPASASLLIGLAISDRKPLKGIAWADATQVKAMRVADFSCGTGTLLATAYQRIGQMHELAGGDSEAIHPSMMAHSLVGCDVLPAAAHLTASMLSGSHPTVKYKQSAVLTLAYGVLPNGNVATGSLDLLDPQKKMEVVAITAKAAGGEGESETDIWTTLPHQDFGLIVMNPPFVRATGQEANKRGVPNPMFAAFSASDEDQRLMGKQIARLAAGSSAHGNAGLASYFLVLADKKLSVGGVLALVMPLSLLSGEAWEESRQVIAAKYTDLIVISIAGAKGDEMAFSADTGMGECLLVGVKQKSGAVEAGKTAARVADSATFVVLKQRPASQLQGYSIARQVLKAARGGKLRKLEEGPVGGTKLAFGEEVIGHVISAPLPLVGAWNPTRIVDLSLAQAAYQIAQKGLIWLPSMAKDDAPKVSMTTFGDLGTIGPYHADIDGVTQNGSVRGPFEHTAVADASSSTYPMLWNHEADRERCMCFEADSEGQIRDGAPPEKVKAVWASRSHCHFNQNFQFNSQSTPVQFTKRKTLGGRAWISIGMANVKLEKAAVAWSNTSLGILLHWQHANKQQAGRGNVVPTALESLPTLDLRTLSTECLDKAAEVFDDLCSKELLTVDQIDIDPIRRQLDSQFLVGVLGFPSNLLLEDGPLDLLRKKLAQEPSITGRKQGTAKPKKKVKIAAKKKVAIKAGKSISKGKDSKFKAIPHPKLFS